MHYPKPETFQLVIDIIRECYDKDGNLISVDIDKKLKELNERIEKEKNEKSIIR